jgi:predicted nucleotidyltransferase component of viral defense system
MADAPSAPLRPLRLRLATTARGVGKPLFVVEKDYALSYLLASIAVVPLLRESLVFKGGTCLRKAYFAGYRFSEDLDFTARSPLPCETLLDSLNAAIEHMKQWISAFGPFAVLVAEERQRGPHPRGQCAFRVRVQFPWMRHAECSLKVEVTADEPLLIPPIDRPIAHDYAGESLSATIPCYSLEEIAAEKLRAFLQARQHLRDRGWLRNRPRDLYDLWHLRHLDAPSLAWHEVARILPAKAAAYGLSFGGPEDFRDSRVLEGIKRDWEAQLANFVMDLPPVAQCIAALDALLDEVFGGESGGSL